MQAWRISFFVLSGSKDYRNYSEPSLAHSQNRTMLVLSRCFAANFAHMWGGNSIRVTLK